MSWKNVFLSPGIKTFGTHEFHSWSFQCNIACGNGSFRLRLPSVFFRLFFANISSRKKDNFLKCSNQKNEGKHAKNSKLIGCAKLNRHINPNRNRIRNRSKTGKVFDLYSNLDVLENYRWIHFDMVLFST